MVALKNRFRGVKTGLRNARAKWQKQIYSKALFFKQNPILKLQRKKFFKKEKEKDSNEKEQQ